MNADLSPQKHFGAFESFPYIILRISAWSILLRVGAEIAFSHTAPYTYALESDFLGS